MNPAIDAAAVEAALAFVAARGEQGASVREAAEAIFGSGRGTAHTYMLQILKVAAALGHLEGTKDCDNVLVYRVCDWWPASAESIAITPRLLGLNIHILERGIADGYLGNAATVALLEHLKRERERIDVPARAEEVGT